MAVTDGLNSMFQESFTGLLVGAGVFAFFLSTIVFFSLLIYTYHLTSSKGTSSPRTLPVPNNPPPTSSPFVAAEHLDDGKKHLLLCASGSVATIKLPNIIQALSQHPDLSIRIILTSSAVNFLTGQSAEQPPLSSIESLPNVDGIYLDHHEWEKPWARGGAILHIELRRWADLMVVAPLSANTLAKMATGLSDNLLTSVMRAWDTTGEIDIGRRWGKKIIVVAPAMNTAMWRHPATAKHLRVLQEEWGYLRDGWIMVMMPIQKELACGDTGDGAMREWKDIVGHIEEGLQFFS